ncbi:MAG: hypothetical protein JWM95_5549 [Gemmatimonadetes bacterium]|nr:hypothetical protein [Gemmatimonadota bacterium]
MSREARLQRVAGWAIVLIAFIHLAVTFIDYDTPSLRALWFVGSGFALLLIGGLNLVSAQLNDDALRDVRGVRVLTLVADGCGIVLGLGYVWLTGGTQPQGPVLVALFFAAAGAQLARRVR